MIYFDNAATTPVDDDVRSIIDEQLHFFWGNPSSLHKLGLAADQQLEKARATIARYLGVKPSTITFTSCATESINTVIHGVMRKKKGNIVISSIEHSAVFEAAKAECQGEALRLVPCDSKGRVCVSDVLDCIDEATRLVAIMYVNNELGTVQPVREIAKAVKEKYPAVKVLVDGVQAFGKRPCLMEDTEIDFFVASGHKLHAPKGIGFLYVRSGVTLLPLLEGGGQERGVRSGTENVAFAVGFAAATEKAYQSEERQVKNVRDTVLKRFEEWDGVRINSPQDGSPYILNVGIRGIRSEILLHAMAEKGMYLSSGSACSSGKPSRIIQEIGVPTDYSDGCVRLSFSRYNTVDEANRFMDALLDSVQQIRAIIGRR